MLQRFSDDLLGCKVVPSLNECVIDITRGCILRFCVSEICRYWSFCSEDKLSYLSTVIRHGQILFSLQIDCWELLSDTVEMLLSFASHQGESEGQSSYAEQPF